MKAREMRLRFDWSAQRYETYRAEFEAMRSAVLARILGVNIKTCTRIDAAGCARPAGGRCFWARGGAVDYGYCRRYIGGYCGWPF